MMAALEQGGIPPIGIWMKDPDRGKLSKVPLPVGSNEGSP